MRVAVLTLVGWLSVYGSLIAADFVSLGFLPLPTTIELGAMSGVAVDAADRIYVLHRGTPPLLAFDAELNYVRGWGAGLFKTPHGLRIDGQGHVWTTDNGNHVLRKFSPDGELLATLGTEGTPQPGADGFRSPDDLVFDTAGHIYVADAGNGRIVKLDPAGKFLQAWGKKGKGPGEFATAHSLAIDAMDRLYLGDRGNQRIQVFTTSGEHLADWTGLGNPFGLIWLGDELVAAEGDQHLLGRFDRDGKFLGTWGSPETLQLPHLMATNSRGVLFVAEVNGKRVQLLRRDLAEK
jgi:hypothetical protein